MGDVADLIADVREGPRGAEVGAFFDFDGTLISGYSANVFYRERLRRLDVSPAELARSVVAGLDMSLRGSDVTRLMEVGVAALEGRSDDELMGFAERLFVQNLGGMLYPEALTLLRAHRQMGHTIALATSATRYQGGPLAAELGIEHVLCTELEVENGVLTGRLGGPVLWGEGKARAVREFASEQDLDLSQSYAYGNGDEDVAFLETVGRPRPLNPESGLERVARERDWPVSRFASRGRPGLRPLVRTGAAIAGLAAATGVSAGLGLLNGSRRQAANLAAGVGSELLLALAGVELEVTGEEHAWSRRPAVFLFNHQSALDVFVLGSVLRRDFTGVAKKELSRDPLFAAVGYLADVAYIDRANTRQAKAALAPVVERLRVGVSIAMAPEGTRTPTPRLRPFKKGAFHVAMQAGAPIVPVVIRNAGEAMWRGSTVIRPGTVQVAVLPPIPTDGWHVDELEDRVAEVRRRFEETLEEWPDGRPAPARPERRARRPGPREPAPAPAR